VEKQKLSAVVFDCDGVLIESNAIKTLAFGQTVDEFGQKAMDQLMNHHRENGGISRFKKFEWFYREVVNAPLSDEMMNTLCDRFTQLCIESVLDASKVLMVGDAVNDLRAAQYCNALFYGRGKRFSEDNVPWSDDLTGLVDYLSCYFELN